MNRTLKIGLGISAIAIVLSVFAHPTILRTPPAVTQAEKVEILDASKMKPLSFDFVLTKNGESVNSASAHVLSGETYNYGVTDSTGYLKSAVEKDGITTLTPGSISSGFELELKPILRPDGNITISFNAKQTDLNSMDTVIKDGLQVQEPNTTSYATEQVVEVAQGKTFQAQIFDRENAKDKYVLTIKFHI